MNKLDLHGVRHCDVNDIVDEFIGLHIMGRKTKEVHIITGYSERMKELVYEVLCDYKLEYHEHQYNKGLLVISLL